MRRVRRPATPVAAGLVRHARGPGLDRLGADAGDRPTACDLVRGVLPPGVPDAARTLALALGLGDDLALARPRPAQAARLVARGRARDRVGASRTSRRASTSRRRPSTWSCSSRSCASRRQFVAPGDPATVVPLVQVVAALARLPCRSCSSCIYDHDAYSERIEEALAARSSARSAFRALWLWLRPLPGRAAAVGEDRERAAELVQEHGTDSLAYFALRRDKSYFFSPSGRSFLAYRVVGGTALVAGDPIGERQRARRADRASSSASRTRRAGASRSPARRTRRSRTTPRSASSRCTSATRR